MGIVIKLGPFIWTNQVNFTPLLNPIDIQYTLLTVSNQSTPNPKLKMYRIKIIL